MTAEVCPILLEGVVGSLGTGANNIQTTKRKLDSASSVSNCLTGSAIVEEVGSISVQNVEASQILSEKFLGCN